MSDLREIKNLVEIYLKIDNIEFKTRKREYVFARYVAWRLSKDFTRCSLAKIGEIYGNKDHASVLHGLKEFKNLFNQNTFSKYKDIYMKLFKHFYSLEKLNIKDGNIEDVDLVKTFYRIKHIELIDKSHKVINNYRERIEKLNTKEIFKKLSELDNEIFIKFESRAEAFLTMNKNKKDDTQRRNKKSTPTSALLSV